MSLGLSHSLTRFKLKFSPDEVDAMVVQAIALLDDLGKEVNIYAMRVKEWYGWHFPEMAKIISDNVAYAKIIRHMGFRTDASVASISNTQVNLSFFVVQMARMVATKASLSIHVDPLIDADSKSDESANSISVENRAILEKRLLDLESQADFSGIRSQNAKKTNSR